MDIWGQWLLLVAGLGIHFRLGTVCFIIVSGIALSSEKLDLKKSLAEESWLSPESMSSG